MTGPGAAAARVALITGGTDGIGKATARRLLADGWRVVITARSAARGEATVAELVVGPGGERAGHLVGDLSLMGDVRAVARAFRAVHKRLDALVLNANAITQERVLTAEGIESNLAIGYLGRALLTWALEDVLRGTPGSQILTVVGLNLERVDLRDSTTPGRFTSMRALGQWQWAMQVFSREFNRRSPVPMNVFMPGLVRTKILANEPQPMRTVVRLANLLVGIPVERSAEEVTAVLEDAARGGRHDAYYARKKLKPPRDLKLEPGDEARLWDATEGVLRPYLDSPPRGA